MHMVLHFIMFLCDIDTWSWTILLVLVRVTLLALGQHYCYLSATKTTMNSMFK